MKSTWHRFSVLTIALATLIALAAPAESFAQRGGGGGRGGGGHGGGHGGGGGHGVGRGGGGGGSSHAGPRGGGGRGNSGQSWNGGNRSGGNWSSGQVGRQQYSGHWGNPGVGSRNHYRGGSSSLNQLYRGYYNSGYRGNIYGYGRPGFGPSYGRYGYGYFPWYVGLAAYGLNVNRGYGYGVNNGYVGSSAPVIVERYDQTASQSAQPAEGYVPQLNRTTTVLGAQPSGTAVLGVTMDPQYAEAAVVRTVTPGSAAEKAGLRPGDMITTIDGAEVRSPADVTNLVASREAGAQIEMEFIRPILRSEVREAAPEQGLGVTAPQPTAAPTPARSATETIPPPVPQPPTPPAN